MVVILTGCQKQDEVVVETPSPEPEKDYVLADLALSIPASTARTRMTDKVVQTDASMFRGISKLSIIPFTKQGKVELNDMPAYSQAANSFIDKTPTNFATTTTDKVFYYNKFYLKYGVASLLTYGQASILSDNPSKAFNGSLIANIAGEKAKGIPDGIHMTPSNMTFELEPIYDEDDAPAQGIAIAEYLTNIAKAKANENDMSWSDFSPSSWLGIRYSNFINKVNGEYNIMAGSGANIMAHVNNLHQTLQDRLNDPELEDDERNVIREIMKRIKDYSKTFMGGLYGLTVTWDNVNNKVTDLSDCTNYPKTTIMPDKSTVQLPDGAAVLLWSEEEDCFVPQIKTSTVADISNITSYAYPAELYYFSNSTIKTSDEDVNPDELVSWNSMSTWDNDVLQLFDDGEIVHSTTKAVAIKSPMEYAVAHLSATVQAIGDGLVEALYDAESNQIPLININNGERSFPVTGMIVGGQNPVGYDFVPETADNGEDHERFLYDTVLRSSDNSVINLNNTESGEFHTLLLQSKERENIWVILELENKSGMPFMGQSGIVYPDTKFYLTGKITLPGGATEDFQKRVFTQDYTSTIAMKVKTLAGAYNVMPNIQTGRLEVSIQMDLKWIQSEPVTIELED